MSFTNSRTLGDLNLLMEQMGLSGRDQVSRDQFARNFLNGVCTGESTSMLLSDVLRMVALIASDGCMRQCFEDSLDRNDPLVAFYLTRLRPNIMSQKSYADDVNSLWRAVVESANVWAIPPILSLIPVNMQAKFVEPVPVLWWSKGYWINATLLAQMKIVPRIAALSLAELIEAGDEHLHCANEIRRVR